MFDEACLIAVELNNQINEKKKKQKEKLNKNNESFQKEMSRLFENDEGEL